MLRIFLLFALFFTAFTSQAQLILNGDFETLSDCPPVFDFETTIQNSMANWLAVQGTADGYHESCEAIMPDNTPNIPTSEYGDGFAALWGPYEAFGCALTESIDPTREYCLTFDAVLTLVDQTEPVLASCASICIYGTNTEPEEPGPFDFPVPIDQIEDLHPLGCSDPLTDPEVWEERSINFVPDNIYAYLVIVTGQESSCYNESNYLAIDNVDLVECSTSSIASAEASSPLLYPNPASGVITISSLPREARSIEIIDHQGRVLSVSPLMGGDRTAQLSLSELNDGMVIVIVRDVRGKIVFIERVLIQH